MTAMASGWPVAHRLVPSSGSTAMSTLGELWSSGVCQPWPTFSPMKSIGASSRSPSPMTTVPRMSVVSNIRRSASTARWSAALRSPRPMRRAEASAAASVTRTISRARLRSFNMPAAWHTTVPASTGAERRAERLRDADRLAASIDAGVQSVAVGDQLAVPPDLVGEAYPGEPELGHLDVDIEQVLVMSGAPVLAERLGDREGNAELAEMPPGEAAIAQKRRARRLEPAEVVGVVHDPHLIGVAEDDAHLVDHHSAIRMSAGLSTTTASLPIWW